MKTIKQIKHYPTMRIKKPVFVMNSIIVGATSYSTPRNLHEFGSLYHTKNDVHITWLLDYPTLKRRDDLKKAVMEFHRKYDDEVTFFNYNDPIRFDQNELRERLETCIGILEKLTGKMPESMGSWLLNSDTASIAAAHGIKTAIGQVWEQYGVDGLSSIGSINGPYYPSCRHFLLPAQAENDCIDVLLLDALSCDMIDTKIPKHARATVHPWDSHLTAFAGSALQQFITKTYVEDNLSRNEFGWLNNTVELEWMYQDYLVYNTRYELKKRQENWLVWLYSNYPQIQYCSLSDFGKFFRQKYRDNSQIIYRFKQNSRFNPFHHAYWFFSKNMRACLEYKCSRDSDTTIILDADDFRSSGQWADGYDTACYEHPAYPEEKARTTPVVGCRDKACFTVKKNSNFFVWILSDGTEASDIEVFIDGISAGIAGGTRGSDDWCCLPSVRLTAGTHILELVNKYNENGAWFAVYAQVILSADPEFRPARGRILDCTPCIQLTDYTDYRTMTPAEPVPPAENWPLPSGYTSWKMKLPATEIFKAGKRALHLSAPEYHPIVSFDRRGRHEDGEITIAQPRLITKADNVICYNLRLTEFYETVSETVLRFDVFENQKCVLQKEISISTEAIKYKYFYHMKFDELILTDMQGQIITRTPPQEILFTDRKINFIYPNK